MCTYHEERCGLWLTVLLSTSSCLKIRQWLTQIQCISQSDSNLAQWCWWGTGGQSFGHAPAGYMSKYRPDTIFISPCNDFLRNSSDPNEIKSLYLYNNFSIYSVFNVYFIKFIHSYNMGWTRMESTWNNNETFIPCIVSSLHMEGKWQHNPMVQMFSILSHINTIIAIYFMIARLTFITSALNEVMSNIATETLTLH